MTSSAYLDVVKLVLTHLVSPVWERDVDFVHVPVTR